MSAVSSKDSPRLRSITVDGKKFLWDGGSFKSHDEALHQAEAYKNENFEIYLVRMDESYLVYSRRVVKETAVPMS
jgi:hypothetical protein